MHIFENLINETLFTTSTDLALVTRIAYPADALPQIYGVYCTGHLADAENAAGEALEFLLSPAEGEIDAVLERVGDHLTRSLVCGCRTLAELCEAAGGYRPTLRPDLGRRFEQLADLYDHAQQARGDARRAYRGN